MFSFEVFDLQLCFVFSQKEENKFTSYVVLITLMQHKLLNKNKIPIAIKRFYALFENTAVSVCLHSFHETMRMEFRDIILHVSLRLKCLSNNI